MTVCLNHFCKSRNRALKAKTDRQFIAFRLDQTYCTLRGPTCQSWHIKVFSAFMAELELLSENGEKYPLHLNRRDHMKILSVLQDHCGIHKNFINIFLKNYYGVYISLNFRFHTKNNLFGFQFNKFVGKSSKIRSLLLN